ncbi:MAG: hypothetical protein V2A66_01125 [Pseudomonadota bacterium]
MARSIIDIGLLERLDPFLCNEGEKANTVPPYQPQNYYNNLYRRGPGSRAPGQQTTEEASRRKDAPYCNRNNRQAVNLDSYSPTSSLLSWETPVEVRFCQDFNALNKNILPGRSGADPAALEKIGAECHDVMFKHVSTRGLRWVVGAAFLALLGSIFLKRKYDDDQGGDDDKPGKRKAPPPSSPPQQAAVPQSPQKPSGVDLMQQLLRVVQDLGGEAHVSHDADGEKIEIVITGKNFPKLRQKAVDVPSTSSTPVRVEAVALPAAPVPQPTTAEPQPPPVAAHAAAAPEPEDMQPKLTLLLQAIRDSGGEAAFLSDDKNTGIFKSALADIWTQFAKFWFPKIAGVVVAHRTRQSLPEGAVETADAYAGITKDKNEDANWVLLQLFIYSGLPLKDLRDITEDLLKAAAEPQPNGVSKRWMNLLQGALGLGAGMRNTLISISSGMIPASHVPEGYAIDAISKQDSEWPKPMENRPDKLNEESALRYVISRGLDLEWLDSTMALAVVLSAQFAARKGVQIEMRMPSIDAKTPENNPIGFLIAMQQAIFKTLKGAPKGATIDISTSPLSGAPKKIVVGVRSQPRPGRETAAPSVSSAPESGEAVALPAAPVLNEAPPPAPSSTSALSALIEAAAGRLETADPLHLNKDIAEKLRLLARALKASGAESFFTDENAGLLKSIIEDAWPQFAQLWLPQIAEAVIAHRKKATLTTGDVVIAHQKEASLSKEAVEIANAIARAIGKKDGHAPAVDDGAYSAPDADWVVSQLLKGGLQPLGELQNIILALKALRETTPVPQSIGGSARWSARWNDMLEGSLVYGMRTTLMSLARAMDPNHSKLEDYAEDAITDPESEWHKPIAGRPDKLDEETAFEYAISKRLDLEWLDSTMALAVALNIHAAAEKKLRIEMKVPLIPSQVPIENRMGLLIAVQGAIAAVINETVTDETTIMGSMFINVSPSPDFDASPKIMVGVVVRGMSFFTREIDLPWISTPSALDVLPAATPKNFYAPRNDFDASNVASMLEQVKTAMGRLIEAAQAQLISGDARAEALSKALDDRRDMNWTQADWTGREHIHALVALAQAQLISEQRIDAAQANASVGIVALPIAPAGRSGLDWAQKQWNKIQLALPPGDRFEAVKNLIIDIERLGRLAPMLRSEETLGLMGDLATRFEQVVLGETVPKAMDELTSAAMHIKNGDEQAGAKTLDDLHEAIDKALATNEQLAKLQKALLPVIPAIANGMTVPGDSFEAAFNKATHRMGDVIIDTGHVLNALALASHHLPDEKQSAIRAAFARSEFNLSNMNGLLASARMLNLLAAQKPNKAGIRIKKLETNISVPSKEGPQLFRIVYKMIRNPALSGATEIEVSAAREGKALKIIIGYNGAENSIVELRKLCDAKGWKLDIVSRPGTGTTATLTIADEWVADVFPAPRGGSGSGGSGAARSSKTPPPIPADALGKTGVSSSASAAAGIPRIVVAGVSGMSRPRIAMPDSKRRGAAWRHRMAEQSHPDAANVQQQGAEVFLGITPAPPPPVVAVPVF